MDGHRRLVVLSRGEDLALIGGDGRILFDQPGHDASQGFYTKGEGSHIERQHIIHIPFQDATLNGGTKGHNLIRVHALVRLFTKDLFDPLLDGWHAGHAAHQDNLIHVAG